MIIGATGDGYDSEMFFSISDVLGGEIQGNKLPHPKYIREELRLIRGNLLGLSLEENPEARKQELAGKIGQLGKELEKLAGYTKGDPEILGNINSAKAEFSHVTNLLGRAAGSRPSKSYETGEIENLLDFCRNSRDALREAVKSDSPVTKANEFRRKVEAVKARLGEIRKEFSGKDNIGFRSDAAKRIDKAIETVAGPYKKSFIKFDNNYPKSRINSELFRYFVATSEGLFGIGYKNMGDLSNGAEMFAGYRDHLFIGTIDDEFVGGFFLLDPQICASGEIFYFRRDFVEGKEVLTRKTIEGSCIQYVAFKGLDKGSGFPIFMQEGTDYLLKAHEDRIYMGIPVHMGGDPPAGYASVVGAGFRHVDTNCLHDQPEEWLFTEHIMRAGTVVDGHPKRKKN